MKPEERSVIIERLMTESTRGRTKMLNELGIPRSTYYNWVKRYNVDGAAKLKLKHEIQYVWNRLSEPEELNIISIAKEHPELSARLLSIKITDEQQFYVSEATVYRVLKKNGLMFPRLLNKIAASKTYKDKTTKPDEMWQCDAFHAFIVGWGYYKCIPVIDDYSRKILSSEVFPDETSNSIATAIELAQETARSFGHILDTKPKLLSDNGSGFKGEVLHEYLSMHGIKHIFGKPYHPQTQGKVERVNRTLQEKTTYLIVYCSPEEFRQAVRQTTEEYNDRPHKSLKNVSPNDVYEGRMETILTRRLEIKKLTLERRKMYNKTQALLEHKNHA